MYLMMLTVSPPLFVTKATVPAELVATLVGPEPTVTEVTLGVRRDRGSDLS